MEGAPLAFNLALMVPVFVVFVWFFMRWFGPRRDDDDDHSAD